MVLINILPEEIIRKIYSQLSPNNRTNFRCCNKEIASICPAIPSNAFLTGYVPPLLRNDNNVHYRKYETITLTKLTRIIDESVQMITYRKTLPTYINSYMYINDIKKIMHIIQQCFSFILYNCYGYNQIICKWKYCNEFINATNSGFSNFGKIVAIFLTSIFYKQ